MTAQSPAESPVERVRRNIQSLMDKLDITQVQLAARIGKSQSWVSKRASGLTPWKLRDMDTVASALNVTAEALLQEYGVGGFERRSGRERRLGIDRRRLAQTGGARSDDRQQTFRGKPAGARDGEDVERAS